MKDETTTHYHTSGTDGNLQAAWRQEHARPRVAMGTGVHGELNAHRRLCRSPGLNALGSIRQHGQKGKAGREETCPACILQRLCEAEGVTSISTESQEKEKRHGCVYVCAEES